MSKLQKWRRWCLRIEEDILLPYKFNKLVAEEYFSIIKPHLDEGKPATFHNWCSDNYGVSIALVLRKLTDGDKRVYSVRRLVGDIQANSKCIKKASYIKRYPVHFRKYAEDRWNSEVSNRHNYLPASIPANHLAEIEAISQRINSITNKFIAHTNRAKNKRFTLKFDEIYDVIRRLISIAAFYSDLVGAQIPDDDANVSDFTEWKDIFREAWLNS